MPTTRWRLSSRTVAPTSVTTYYIHDLADHIIAELDTNGQTQREYIWLDDMPVAVVDGVASGTPTFYYVHVDHLNRPIRMTVQARTRAWEAKYAPFGATTSIFVNPAVMNLRFPGQWFQLETGLAYNWHRHYDASIGRYVQPDPLVVDEGDATVSGVAMDIFNGIRGNEGDATAKMFGWRTPRNSQSKLATGRVLQPDGPSKYTYVGHNPLQYTDSSGLIHFCPTNLAERLVMQDAMAGGGVCIILSRISPRADRNFSVRRMM